MANEIVLAFDKGNTLYARVFDSTGKVWNGSVFETWVDGNVGNYDIAITDKSSGQYIEDFPSTAAGRFKVNIYIQIGVSPAITDPVIQAGEILWDGSSEIFKADEDDVADAHETTDELIVSTFTNVFNIYDES